MRLSDEYQRSFRNMIDKFRNSKVDRTTKLCAFWPMVGSQFVEDRGLLVIGRAVNGWRPGWTIDDIRNDKDVAADARRESEDSNTYCCPMGWVSALEGNNTEYNTRRSPFWRVVKRVAIDLHNGGYESDWACKIGWSNFEKISFVDGGNPSPSLWSVQEQSCLMLLEAELSELKPRHVLAILGDHGWYDSLVEHLKLTLRPPDLQSPYLEAIASNEIGNQQWVFAKRPDSRQKGGNDGQWVKQVVSAFKTAVS